MGPVIQMMMMMSRSEEQDRIPVGAATRGGVQARVSFKTMKNDAFDFHVILRGTDSDCDISPYHL